VKREDPALPLTGDVDQRRRLQVIAAALFAALLVVAGVVVSFRGDGRGNTLNASSDEPTTTRVIPGVVVSTTTPPVTSPATIAPAATTRTTRAPRATTTSTTTQTQTEFPDAPAELVCVQTTPSDPTPPPEDWANYWDERPDENQGLQLKICVEDKTPKVKTTVKLYVLAQDRDAEIGTGPCDIHVNWDSAAGDSPCTETVFAPPPEPKPTPEPAKPPGGRITMTFVHQFDEPRQYVIKVGARSGQGPERNPYASYNSIELRVNAHR
jgi:hypothetical protein